MRFPASLLTALLAIPAAAQPQNVAPTDDDYSRRVVELPDGTPTTPSACTPTAAPAWSGQRGAKWVNGHFNDTIYNHFLPPNSILPDCQNGHHNYALTSARSNHTGGVQATLCDGSVRFVSDSVDLAVWRGIATRQGGEVVGEF